MGKLKIPPVITEVCKVTSDTSQQTSKRKFALGLKNKLTSGEIVNPFAVVTS